MWKDTIKKKTGDEEGETLQSNNMMRDRRSAESYKTGDTMERPVSVDKVALIGKYGLVKKLRMINQELQLIGEDVLDNVIEGSKDLREFDMDSEDIIRFFSILSQALLKESEQMESL